MPVRVPKDTRNKVEQTKQRMNGAPASQHGGNMALKSVAPSVYKLASGGSVHTAGVAQETKRSNPSDEAWGEVTAEVQVLLCWTPEDPASNGGVATIQHCCELGETAAAEDSPAVNNLEVVVEGRRTEQRWTAHIVLSTSVWKLALLG